MWKSANGIDANIDELEDYLVKYFGLYGGHESVDAWVMWRRSNYVTLPFSGGWLEQPEWVRKDFLKLDIRRQWHDLNANRVDTAGMSNPHDKFSA